MLVRLSVHRLVDRSIRGRATGVGSELALAATCVSRAAKSYLVALFEVGAGVVPGGGPM